MNTGVGSLSLLQQIFLTQESNWDLLHCKWILYQLSYQGSLHEEIQVYEHHCHLRTANHNNEIPLCCGCSLTQLSLILCNPMDCNTPGFPVLHCLLEFAQTYVHWVNGTIHLSHSLLPPSPALNLFQLRGIFQWADSSHQVLKVSGLQLQLLQTYCITQWLKSKELTTSNTGKNM